MVSFMEAIREDRLDEFIEQESARAVLNRAAPQNSTLRSVRSSNHSNQTVKHPVPAMTVDRPESELRQILRHVLFADQNVS